MCKIHVILEIYFDKIFENFCNQLKSFSKLYFRITAHISCRSAGKFSAKKHVEPSRFILCANIVFCEIDGFLGCISNVYINNALKDFRTEIVDEKHTTNGFKEVIIRKFYYNCRLRAGH